MVVFRLSLSMSALVALCIPGCSFNKLPGSAQTILEKADRIELFSLDPETKHWKSGTGLYGWQILGSTILEDEVTRHRVVSALLKGIKESDGSELKCFWPRHGIRATYQGKTADFVICFHCLFMKTY